MVPGVDESTPGPQGAEPPAVGAELSAKVAGKAANLIGSAVGSPLVGRVAEAAAGAVVRSKTGRRALTAVAAVLVALLIGVVIAVGSVIQSAAMMFASGTGNGSQTDSQCVDFIAATGMSADQQANAATIVGAVQSRGFGSGDAVTAVMTALTESSLVNVNHGDLAGPDSLGLFQQRDTWGISDVRLDPAGATGLFLDRLTAPGLKLAGTVTFANVAPNSRTMFAPWLLAQSVQVSAFVDGSNYRARYARAVKIVTDILGADAMTDANAQRWADAGGLTLITGTDPVVDASQCESGNGDVTTGTGPGAWGGYSNGGIPASALCPIPWVAGQLLRCDAATSFVAMNTTFRAAFGYDIGVTDSYRSLAEQYAVQATKGYLAATPGTSNHGWALAVDLGAGINNFGTPQHQWMVANAPGFGWVHPAWAEPGGSKPEPWHWEFNGTVGGP